jgi:hypothetical protein
VAKTRRRNLTFHRGHKDTKSVAAKGAGAAASVTKTAPVALPLTVTITSPGPDDGLSAAAGLSVTVVTTPTTGVSGSGGTGSAPSVWIVAYDGTRANGTTSDTTSPFNYTIPSTAPIGTGESMLTAHAEISTDIVEETVIVFVDA